MLKHSIEELEKLIPAYSRSYYLGEPKISDIEFDSLVEELRSLNPSSYILHSVGWGGMDKGFSHRYKTPHIGSLVVGIDDKVKYPSILKDRYSFITPKIDGGSVCLYYRNGQPISLITRGNGREGINVLHKFIDRFPVIEEKGLVCVRGEAYTPKSLFKELEEKGVPSPRNFSTGVLSRDSDKNDPDLKYVHFVFYQVRIFNSDVEFDKEKVLKTIRGFNLPVIKGISLNSTVSVEDLKKYNEMFSQYDWPTDGVVLTKNIWSKKEDYGYNVVEDVTAYKFESESAETKVVNVEWVNGNSGRVNPVVHFEPVFLAGAKIQKATGFNAKFILDNGIDKGALIKITRSNEVIPYIQETIDPVDNPVIPTHCSCCGSDLTFDGTTLFCLNKECVLKRVEQCNRILTLEDIPLGLGGKGGVNIEMIIDIACEGSPSLEKMIEFILTKDWTPFDGKLSPHYYGLAKKHFDNLYNHIVNGLTASEFWYVIHLPSVSKANSEKLPFPELGEDYSKFKLTPSFRKVLKEYKEKIDSTLLFLKENNIKINSVQVSSVDIIPVCYTGATDKFKTRSEFFGFYANKVKEVSVKSARYLICNKPSNSSKYKYATTHNVPIVTEAEFLDILNQN